MINVLVSNVVSTASDLKILTAGMVKGRSVKFTFSDDWDDLIRTAVFTNGIDTRQIPENLWVDGCIAEIPPEVLTTPHVPVKCGVYGIGKNGEQVIPTLWCELGRVFPSASPNDYPGSVPPTPEVWENLQIQIGKLNNLGTEDKTNLVNAINEVVKSVILSAGMKTYRGEIFNDYENNQALKEYTHASGFNTKAGAKAFSFDEEYYSVDRDPITEKESRVYHLNAPISELQKLKAVIDSGEKPQYTVLLTNNYDFNGVVEEVDVEACTIKVSNFLMPNEKNADSGVYVTSQKLRTVADFGIDRSYILIIDHDDIGDILIGEYARAEGEGTHAVARASYAGGRDTRAYGKYSHTEGRGTVAAYCAHAEGNKTKALADSSHTEGTETIAFASNAHAEGYRTKAYGKYSHTEGIITEANGIASHAEGNGSIASGDYAHAEGLGAKATANFAHAEGYHTEANAEASHAGGRVSKANHKNSFAHGFQLRTSRDNQAVFGQCNADDADALLIVGNADYESNRSNAFVVRKDGRATVGKNPTSLMDVATLGSVNSAKEEALSALNTHKKTAENSYLKKSSAQAETLYAHLLNTNTNEYYDGVLKFTSGIYYKDSDGTYKVAKWMIPQRNGIGSITVPTPVSDTDSANKKYVDDSIVEVKKDLGDINTALQEIIELQEELLIPDSSEVSY